MWQCIAQDKDKAVTGNAPKRRKINAAANKKTVEASLKNECFSLTVDGCEGARPKLFFDDMVRCIFGALDGLEKHELNMVEIRASIRKALELVFYKSVKIDGEEVRSWSVLRGMLRAFMIKSHVGPLSRLHSGEGKDFKASLLDDFKVKETSTSTTTETARDTEPSSSTGKLLEQMVGELLQEPWALANLEKFQVVVGLCSDTLPTLRHSCQCKKCSCPLARHLNLPSCIVH